MWQAFPTSEYYGPADFLKTVPTSFAFWACLPVLHLGEFSRSPTFTYKLYNHAVLWRPR